MSFYNVTYKFSDEGKFVEAMNQIRPETYNVRPYYRTRLLGTNTEMVEITDEEALMLTLSVALTVEKVGE